MKHVVEKKQVVDGLSIDLEDGCKLTLSKQNFLSIETNFQQEHERYLIKIKLNSGTYIHFHTENEELVEDVELFCLGLYQ